jgi:hypothetical protein
MVGRGSPWPIGEGHVRLTRLNQKLVTGIAGSFLLPSVLAPILVALYRWGAFGDTFTWSQSWSAWPLMMRCLGLIAHTIG